MKNTIVHAIALFGLAALFLQPLRAQDEKDMLAQLAVEEQEAIEALVLYPEATRLAILEACLHPEVLVKMNRLQEASSNAVREMMEGYPREAQEAVWDVSRYPGLTEKLLATGPESGRAGIEALLADYPEAVHENAVRAGIDYRPLLEESYRQQRSAEQAFESLLADYPPKAQDALRQLLELPEVLSILNEHIHLAILTGDIYRRDPEWLRLKADSLNLEVARANAEELEDWKNSLEEDPQALAELERSAEAFASEYGYDDEFYGYPEPDDDLYYDESEQAYVVEHHYYYHYSYWWGYPYWYSYPRWRPYPYWYDWGFYFGPRRTIVVIGMPSFYFTQWYFYYPHHHYRYAHFSAHLIRHYRYHPRSASSITTSVAAWQNRNREVIRRDWLENGRQLENGLREFAQLEAARNRYNRDNTGQKLSQQAYLEQHKTRYPALADQMAQSRKAYREPVPEARTVPPAPEPDIRPPAQPKPRTAPPAEKPRTRTVPTERREPIRRERVITPEKKPVPKNEQVQPRNLPEVERGSDYHKRSWEKPRTTTKPRSPQPRSPSPAQPQPRKEAPSGKTQRRGN